MSTSFAEALAPLSARMPCVVREHEVLRIAGLLPGDDPGAIARAAAAEVLKWAQRQAGGNLPQAAWNGESFELPLPGRDPSAIRLLSGASDLWAFRMNRPDADIPGRAWTTEVVLGHLPGEPVRISTRLLAATDEAEFSITPAVPSFVRQIAEKSHLLVGSQVACAKPTVYRDSNEADLLIDHLTNPYRVLPTFVLTAAEGAFAPSINAEALARALAGLAHVAIADADASWRLTERLGKRLSVFGGATRVYMPGFDGGADPFGHRLVLGAQLASSDGAARTTRWLQEIAAQASLHRTRLGTDVLTFAAIRSADLEVHQTVLHETNATAAEQLGAALERIKALQGQMDTLKGEQDYYLTEYEKERERAEAAEAQAQKAAWRIQQLTDQLRAGGGDPDSGSVLPTAWDKFAEWCDQQLAGRLVLTPDVRRGVRKPDFANVEAAAHSLLWLATVGRDRFINGGGSLSNITILDGIQNAPCGADAYDFDWNARRFSADWHVKNGGNTRDPVRCLRIYYCFDEQTQQIIVSDMPTHRHTGAT